MNGASALVKALSERGITHVFGYPGGQAMRIFDEIERSDIECVLVRHEQGAVHAADGFSRAGDTIGVVIVTSGPGATNTLTGIATAYMDSIPLIVITAQVPRDEVGTDSFQESDIFGMSMPVVKHSYLITDVEQIVPVIQEAHYLATSGRPGPVLIDIPSDILAAPVTYNPHTRRPLDSYKPTLKGNGKQIRRAQKALVHATRPLIIAGGGIRSPKSQNALDELCEMLSAPVFTSLMGKGSIDEQKPYALGPIGLHGSLSAYEAVKSCDVLLIVGCHLSNRVTGNTETFISADTTVIHIDIDPAEISKVLPADIPIVGDAGEVLCALLEQINASKDALMTTDAARKEWLTKISECRVQEHFPQIPEVTGDTINPLAIMSSLSDHMAKKPAILITDVGQHQMWAMQGITITKHSKFITSGGLGTMGFGLPAALGIAKAVPDTEIILVTGDGSIQMNIQEMASIHYADVPIHIVLIDNSALGMVKQMQEALFDGRSTATAFYSNPDFVLLAKAYGWESASVVNPVDLDEALAVMHACPHPYLLQVRISDELSVYPMHV